MNTKTTVLLVKELEKMNLISSRNNYRGAWSGLIISIIWLTSLFLGYMNNPDIAWLRGIFFVVALVMLLQSFFLIIRHLTYKKIGVIIEAILENQKE
jgi:hypothetical protein